MKTKYKETKFENFIWIDICNPDKNSLDGIARDFDLDFYQIRDSLETGHLPKVEKQKNYSFIILRAYTANFDEKVTNVTDLSNKIAFFYNAERVITVHRSTFDFLGKINLNPNDSEEFLLQIIHRMLETYEAPAKALNDENDNIEKTIFLKDYSEISLEDLYFQKAQTRITKKLLQITQNVINQIEVSEKSKTALQDIKDKLLSLVLNYEEILENSNNLLNTYLSVNAQKTNDVMKLLTIFSAFFLPLTFIAGIYGMNFDNMPELRWKFGYFITLGIMITIALIIFLWFKRKKII